MIKVICVGKIKEKFFMDAVKEFGKRLSKYTKLQVIEVPDENNSSIDVCLKKEGSYIVKYINDKEFVITLEIDGIKMNSVQLSKKIETLLIDNSNLTFVIGGSNGLDNTIKERRNLAISFSDLTFPHQLFRVILLEQIYRAFKIINNESYHK